MTILDDAQKIQNDAKIFLDSLGKEFQEMNKGKTVIVFPYLKDYVSHENPLEAEKLSTTKHDREISYTFKL